MVRALRFGDTPHCGHFRRHRADYTLALQRFLSDDLKAGPLGGLLKKAAKVLHMLRLSAPFNSLVNVTSPSSLCVT